MKDIPLSPQQLRGQGGALTALTNEQRQFAAESHNLIYAYLKEKGWPEQEYYDIAAFGFLRAVKRYLTEPGLRRYAFSTIAWRNMGQSIDSFHHSETLRRESEQRYLDTVRNRASDAVEDLEMTLILHDLACVASKEQYRFAAFRLQGYTVAEIARSQGVDPKRVKRMLKSMYQVYLCLSQNDC